MNSIGTSRCNPVISSGNWRFMISRLLEIVIKGKVTPVRIQYSLIVVRTTLVFKNPPRYWGFPCFQLCTRHIVSYWVNGAESLFRIKYETKREIFSSLPSKLLERTSWRLIPIHFQVDACQLFGMEPNPISTDRSVRQIWESFFPYVATSLLLFLLLLPPCLVKKW